MLDQRINLYISVDWEMNYTKNKWSFHFSLKFIAVRTHYILSMDRMIQENSGLQRQLDDLQEKRRNEADKFDSEVGE